MGLLRARRTALCASDLRHLSPAPLRSPASMRLYVTALERLHAFAPGPLTRPVVVEWRAHLVASGLAPATVNAYLSMLRAGVREAAATGRLEPEAARRLLAVPGVRVRGFSRGRWLSLEESRRLLAAPPTGTLRGRRDRAALAIMLGAGLRRAEAASIEVRQLRLLDGCWALADVTGKGGRSRTVPVATWVADRVRAWIDMGALTSGPLLRRVARGRVQEQGLSPATLADIVRTHARRAGLGHVAPHDLRRTFARLALDGGARLDQIQLALGHRSIHTTEIYLGTRQDLTHAPSAYIRL